MPNKLRVLSGDDIIFIFHRFGFNTGYSKGSHFKLTRVTDGEKQVIVIPRHNPIAKGTLKSIYRKALEYISEEELRSYFYTD